MSWNHPRRFRISLVVAVLAVAGLVYHQDIIGHVAYAVEKGKLDAGKDKLAKVEDISDVFRLVSKEVKPAVVLIRTTSARKETLNKSTPKMDPKDLPEPFRQFFEEYGGRDPDTLSAPSQVSSGSGVIIDAKNGYILTNNHVVSEGDNAKTRIDVSLPDGRHIGGRNVTVLGTDPKTDLALIQIKADRLHAVALGDSAKMEVGDWVLAIGAPFGLDQTVTQGIISATGRSNVGIANYGAFLQTDAAINPGNSGGPLVNMHGEIIGINTAIATNGLAAGYMGVGFAIPSNMIKDILPYLEKGEEVVRGYLGVQIRGLDTFEPGFEKTFGLPEGKGGVLIEDFAKIPGISEVPAQKAGLKIDDIILSYDGHPVKSANELQDRVAHTKPDQKANLLVWRDGKEITIPVVIEKQPKNFFDRSAQSRRGGRNQRPGDEDEEQAEVATIDAVGLTAEPLSEATAKRFGWDQSEARDALIVTQVEPLGEAANLGIRPGDLLISVQGQPVKSVGALKKALSKEALAKGVRIKVRTPRVGYSTLFLQINP